MPRHPVSTRIRKPTRQTDNPAKDVGVSREPLARIIAPLPGEEEETADINDDDRVASPPGFPGICSSTDIDIETAPDPGGRAMARESVGPAARLGKTSADGL